MECEPQSVIRNRHNNGNEASLISLNDRANAEEGELPDNLFLWDSKTASAAALSSPLRKNAKQDLANNNTIMNNFSDVSEEKSSTGQTATTQIKITYPSHKMSQANLKFIDRYKCMQQEADEHYRLLVDL